MKNKYEKNEELLILIQEIEDGIFCRFGEFHIQLKKDGRIEITAFLPENIKTIYDIQVEDLETELERVKIKFHEKVNRTNLLKENFTKKEFDYCLNYDYGGGSITVCSEIEGVYKINLIDKSGNVSDLAIKE